MDSFINNMSQSSWLFAAAAALHPRPWNGVSQSLPREGGSWKRAAAVNRRAETGPRTQHRPVAAVLVGFLSSILYQYEIYIRATDVLRRSEKESPRFRVLV